MAENDIVAFKELASGGFREVALTPADIAAASSTHASTHHTGGSDALAAHQINGQTIFSAASAIYNTDQTLGANRARQLTIGNTNAGGINVTLPTGADGTLLGDTFVLIGGSSISGSITIRRVNVLDPLIYGTLATITATGQQYRFRSSGGTTGDWSLVPVDTHTHEASAITSGTLDFDRIQQVLEVEIDGTEGTPTEVDLTTNIVGGNLHALVVLLGADSEAYSKVVLPALGAAATGKVTVRVNEFEDDTDDFVQIVLDDDTAIFPASSYTEMDPDEELTFRWNDGRWDMDLRPNPSATTAVSIFKPNASGTLALNPMTTAGDIVVGGTSGAPARLALGTASQQLRVNSGATSLEYFTPSAGGSTNLWIPASAWIPKTTAGCGVDSRETTTNDQNFDELLFDTGSDEFADALVVMPSNYNNGTVTARFYWTAASGSGGVAWGIQGRAFANDDALDTAAGTAQLVTDTLIAANDMHITSATSAVTIGGTPAANTPIQFTIYRDVSDAGDDLAVDARLLGVEILFN
jgi:hypothetical protein